MDDLKPCPFCGGDDIRVVSDKNDPWVWCNNRPCPIYDIEITIVEWQSRDVCKEDHVSDWISVEDRLPDNDCLAVVSFVFGGDGSRPLDVREFRNGKFRTFGEISHWMPLPKPPKSKKERVTSPAEIG